MSQLFLTSQTESLTYTLSGTFLLPSLRCQPTKYLTSPTSLVLRLNSRPSHTFPLTFQNHATTPGLPPLRLTFAFLDLSSYQQALAHSKPPPHLDHFLQTEIILGNGLRLKLKRDALTLRQATPAGKTPHEA